jgi:hypothetical protein
MKKLAAKLTRRLGSLASLFARHGARDLGAAASADREALTRERDVYRAECEQLARERDTYRAERDEAARERDVLRTERDTLRAERDRYLTWVPPGHYYSPLPNLDDVRRKERHIFDNVPDSLAAVDLNEAGQLALFEEFKEFYKDQPFSEQKGGATRYYFDNQSYGYADALVLHCMIRHARPKKIIEVGSGFSSCVTLDTNERFFGGSIACTFIEPYPELFLSLLRPGDLERLTFVQSNLQDLDPDLFTALEAGDILFIDSTHVSKVDSDVNYVFFRVLPRLAAGVFVHIHDVFYPFEYPREWVYRGMAWNEDYLLRAFLQYNEAFRVVFFNHFFATFHRDKLAEGMPLCLKNPGGSIWLQKR